jgi:photosystem II stability/assembly factor-like uncharacterized protein
MHLSIPIFIAIVFTSDWRPPSSQIEIAALHDVHFATKRVGMAVGDGGAILRTDDGGKTWALQPPESLRQWRSVFLADNERGTIGGGWMRYDGGGGFGSLISTGDKKWTSLLDGVPGWFHKVRTNGGDGWAIGGVGPTSPDGLWRLSLGGGSAVPRDERIGGPDLLDAAFKGPNKWIAVGGNGRIVEMYARPSGGIRRRVATDIEGLTGALRAVHLTPGGVGCIVGRNRTVLTTVDGGDSWSVARLRLPPAVADVMDFRDVHCASENDFYIVGRPGGYVVRSNDGGGTWKIETTGQPLSLNAIHFLDPYRGWAVGDLGVVCRTANGGITWSVPRSDGRRAAAMFVVSSQPAKAWGLAAYLGGREKLSCVVVQVGGGADWRDEQAISCAATRCGASGWVLTEFPQVPHGDGRTVESVLDYWSRRLDRPAKEALVKRLVSVIRSVRPAILVVGNPNDADPSRSESAAVARIAIEAARHAGDSEYMPELSRLDVHPHQVQRILAPAGSVKRAIRKKGDINLKSNYFLTRLGDTTEMLANRALGYANRLGAESEEWIERSWRSIQPDVASTRPTASRRLNLADEARLPKDLGIRAEQDSPDAGDLSLLRSLVRLQKPSGDYSKILALARNLAKEAKHSIFPADVVCRLAISEGDLIDHDDSAALIEFLLEFGRDHPLWGSVATDMASKMISTEHFMGRGGWSGLFGQDRFVLAADWFGGINRALPYLDPDPTRAFLQAHCDRVLGRHDRVLSFCRMFVEERPDDSWAPAAAADIWLLDGRKASEPSPKPVVEALVTDQPLAIDGQTTDASWTQARWMRLISHDVDARSGELQGRVAAIVSRDSLYIAARLSRLGGRPVLSSSLDGRGTESLDSATDHFSVVLDIDRDHRTYFRFAVDRNGNLRDSLCEDVQWSAPRRRGILRGAEHVLDFAQMEDSGEWTIEIRIPIASILPRPAAEGDVIGMDAIWEIPLDEERRARMSLTGVAGDTVEPHTFGMLSFGPAYPRRGWPSPRRPSE